VERIVLDGILEVKVSLSSGALLSVEHVSWASVGFRLLDLINLSSPNTTLSLVIARVGFTPLLEVLVTVANEALAVSLGILHGESVEALSFSGGLASVNSFLTASFAGRDHLRNTSLVAILGSTVTTSAICIAALGDGLTLLLNLGLLSLNSDSDWDSSGGALAVALFNKAGEGVSEHLVGALDVSSVTAIDGH